MANYNLVPKFLKIINQSQHIFKLINSPLRSQNPQLNPLTLKNYKPIPKMPKIRFSPQYNQIHVKF